MNALDDVTIDEWRITQAVDVDWLWLMEAVDQGEQHVLVNV